MAAAVSGKKNSELWLYDPATRKMLQQLLTKDEHSGREISIDLVLPVRDRASDVHLTMLPCLHFQDKRTCSHIWISGFRRFARCGGRQRGANGAAAARNGPRWRQPNGVVACV
eukprot:SAG31_NODE_176_length_21334_cov_12.211067_2_plen_113_part_00